MIPAGHGFSARVVKTGVVLALTDAAGDPYQDLVMTREQGQQIIDALTATLSGQQAVSEIAETIAEADREA
jgi:hypothetical protein